MASLRAPERCLPSEDSPASLDSGPSSLLLLLDAAYTRHPSGLSWDRSASPEPPTTMVGPLCRAGDSRTPPILTCAFGVLAPYISPGATWAPLASLPPPPARTASVPMADPSFCPFHSFRPPLGSAVPASSGSAKSGLPDSSKASPGQDRNLLFGADGGGGGEQAEEGGDSKW